MNGHAIHTFQFVHQGVSPCPIPFGVPPQCRERNGQSRWRHLLFGNGSVEFFEMYIFSTCFGQVFYYAKQIESNAPWRCLQKHLAQFTGVYSSAARALVPHANQFHSPILGAALRRGIARHWPGVSIAFGAQAIAVDTMFREPVRDCIRTIA